jgi:quinol-cytochrome oxidoreductase complex cytochrome b subunit
MCAKCVKTVTCTHTVRAHDSVGRVACTHIYCCHHTLITLVINLLVIAHLATCKEGQQHTQTHGITHAAHKHVR